MRWHLRWFSNPLSYHIWVVFIQMNWFRFCLKQKALHTNSKGMAMARKKSTHTENRGIFIHRNLRWHISRLPSFVWTTCTCLALDRYSTMRFYIILWVFALQTLTRLHFFHLVFIWIDCDIPFGYMHKCAWKICECFSSFQRVSTTTN